MIIISLTRNNQYKVQYKAGNNEILSTSEPLKNKKSAWKNIHAMAKNFQSTGEVEIAVKDLTTEEPEVFVYDLNGIKNKAGVRK